MYDLHLEVDTVRACNRRRPEYAVAHVPTGVRIDVVGGASRAHRDGHRHGSRVHDGRLQGHPEPDSDDDERGRDSLEGGRRSSVSERSTLSSWRRTDATHVDLDRDDGDYVLCGVLEGHEDDEDELHGEVEQPALDDHRRRGAREVPRPQDREPRDT